MLHIAFITIFLSVMLTLGGLIFVIFAKPIENKLAEKHSAYTVKGNITIGIIFVALAGFLCSLVNNTLDIEQWQNSATATDYYMFLPTLIALIASAVCLSIIIAIEYPREKLVKSLRIIAIILLVVAIVTFVAVGLLGGSVSGESFTNKYGDATTVCAVEDCNEYIASSGDTNCCTQHSNRCLECNCYIDSDAIYCMDCIENALN